MTDRIPTPDAVVSLSGVSFSYGPKPVLKDFSLTVAHGELIALMGPSGSGKSTLLNLIAGLRTAQAGTVTVNANRPVCVFQEPRLFPWLTLENNLRAVLPRESSPEIVRNALDFVGLSGEAGAYPASLSGGMKSRAALARAIAYGEASGSDLYLLDEPFSALDEALRTSLCAALRDRFRKNGTAAILVTHDSSEASAFADRVICPE